MKTITTLALLAIFVVPLSGCVGIGGEKIALSHEPLAAPSQLYSEKLSIQKPADDRRKKTVRIGRATITMFAITSGSITTTTPVTEQVVEQIRDALALLGYKVEFTSPRNQVVDQMKDALTSLGYQVNLAKIDNNPNLASKNPPLKIKVAIDDIYFRNYNWLYPLVPTWGDIKITLIMEGSNNQKLFEKSYEGGDHSLCLSGHCAFETATKRAMTELLNKIIKDFSSSPVRDLITAAYSFEQEKPKEDVGPEMIPEKTD